MAFLKLGDLDQEVKRIVYDSVDIYFNSENIRKLSNEDDQFVMSFFCALLCNNTHFKHIKELLKKDGITKEKVEEYLGFNIENSTKMVLNYKTYTTCETKRDNDPSKFYILNSSVKQTFFNNNWGLRYFYCKTLSEKIDLNTTMLLLYNQLPSSFDLFLEKIANREMKFYKTALYNELDNTMQEELQKEQFKQDKQKLLKYGEFLDERSYITDPAIDREEEISKLMRGVLNDITSVILTGDAGVGKTAIVEGLAYYIQNGMVPEVLKDYKLYKISLAKIVSGAGFVGEFEKKLDPILDIIKNHHNIVLVVDEIHSSFGLGTGSSGQLDFINILKQFTDRGDIKVIGMTTNDEYNDIVKKDSAFKSRFKRIIIEEPEELDHIIINEINRLEKKTNINCSLNSEILEELITVLEDTTKKSSRVFDDCDNNPRLVISIINDAFANARLCDRDSVEISDFCRAIMDNDRIYKAKREESSTYLTNFEKTYEEPKEKSKVTYLDDRRIKKG